MIVSSANSHRTTLLVLVPRPFDNHIHHILYNQRGDGTIKVSKTFAACFLGVRHLEKADVSEMKLIAPAIVMGFRDFRIDSLR